MALPNYGAAAQQSMLMLQKVNKDIQLVGNYDAELDKEFSSVGPGDEIGLQQYRMPLQVETGGQASYYQPDGGNYPQGTGPQYDQKIIAPQAIILAFAATELARRISKAGQDVAVENFVAKMIANAKKKAAHVRNAYLQLFNDGKLATVDASYGGGGNATVPLAAASFGGRLLNRGDVIQWTDNAYNVRASANILDIFKNNIGKPDSMVVDAAPGAGVAGDFIIAQGLASGNPIAVNGLKYLISSSVVGENGGISRANSYVQSPAWNANGAFLTLGGVLAFLARMEQAQGTERFMSERVNNFWYGHQAQYLTAQVLGFAKTTYMAVDGKAPESYDMAPNAFAKRQLAGKQYKSGSMAAIDLLYWLDKGTLKRVRYPDSEKFLPGPLEGMFWPRQAGGLWNSESDILYQDSVQYAVNNDFANGVMFGLGIQAVLQN